MSAKLVLSPMAGVTDAPLRYLARRFGADYAVSEMISSQTQLWDTPKTQQRLKSEFVEQPKILQIAGASPTVIAQAAQACADHGATALEINMGCPAKKVCNVLAGSALLRDESLVAAILQAAVSAVSLPVYLKTRLGWDDHQQNILQIAKIAEDSGIQAITIHGRTRADLYNGSARYDLIRQVKLERAIPVFANGDITTPEKAREVLNYTAADGIYIGRGALGKPWLFRQVKAFLTSGTYQNQVEWSFIQAIILEHLELIYQHYGYTLGVLIARKHIKWYFKANPLGFDPSELFAQFSRLETATAQLEFIQQVNC